jgi:membrane protein DedA with SNARE-associated domain
MFLEELISNYGYAAIGIGAFLEGETILVLGGFAAHSGYLKLSWVIVSAFLGTLFGDQPYFYIGRSKGKGAIEKYFKWNSRSSKVLHFLFKHQTLLILGFRFLYGFRTVAPFLIGASNVAPRRFLILNILGASLWAVLVGVMGYLFGRTLEAVLGDIKKYELLVFAVLAVAGVLVWLLHFRKRPATDETVQPLPESDTTKS